MPSNLILSGGVGHDFAGTSAALAAVLAEAGIDSTVTSDLTAITSALAAPSPPDLITVNALRWRMGAERFAPLRSRWRFELPEAARHALRAHLAQGRGILAVHTAVICFDDWPEWGEILGAAWNWERSWHPPIAPVRVEVDDDHPITAGVTDFTVTDEVYSDLDQQPGLAPLARAGGQPLLWAREVGGGRAVYDALGHDARAYQAGPHRTILKRAARWLLNSS